MQDSPCNTFTLTCDPFKVHFVQKAQTYFRTSVGFFFFFCQTCSRQLTLNLNKQFISLGCCIIYIYEFLSVYQYNDLQKNQLGTEDKYSRDIFCQILDVFLLKMQSKQVQKIQNSLSLECTNHDLLGVGGFKVSTPEIFMSSSSSRHHPCEQHGIICTGELV